MSKYIVAAVVTYTLFVTWLLNKLSISDEQVIAQGLFYPEKVHVLVGPGTSLLMWFPLVLGFILVLIGLFVPASNFQGGGSGKLKALMCFLLIFASSFIVRAEVNYFVAKMQDRQSLRVKELYNKIAEGDLASSAIEIGKKYEISYKIKQLTEYKYRIKFDPKDSDLTTMELYLPYSDNSLILTLTSPIEESESKIITKFCYFSHTRNPPPQIITVDMPNGSKGFTRNPIWYVIKEGKYPCEKY